MLKCSEYVKEVTEIAYHRNGVSGEGFHVIKFTSTAGKTPMLAIVFPTVGHISVFNLDLLGEGEIRSIENGFRGDVFETELRAAIREFEKA